MNALGNGEQTYHGGNTPKYNKDTKVKFPEGFK